MWQSMKHYSNSIWGLVVFRIFKYGSQCDLLAWQWTSNDTQLTYFSCGSFRSVSNLSTLSIYMKEILILSSTSSLNILNYYIWQPGFRNLFSCETALLNIIDKWAMAIDSYNLNGVIFLDQTKAFDLTDHHISIHTFKLHKYPENSISWLSIFLKRMKLVYCVQRKAKATCMLMILLLHIRLKQCQSMKRNWPPMLAYCQVGVEKIKWLTIP